VAPLPPPLVRRLHGSGAAAWGREEREGSSGERGEGAGEDFCIGGWRRHVLGA